MSGLSRIGIKEAYRSTEVVFYFKMLIRRFRNVLVCKKDILIAQMALVYAYMGMSLCEIWYGKCSKISNTCCLPKSSRQTVQTQIRLLLKSDQGLPCLLF